MRTSKPQSCDGKTWYQQLYEEDLEREVQFSKLVVNAKVDSIGRLLARNGVRVESIAELGCGNGDVILECQKRGIGSTYYGVDYSAAAIGHLQTRSSEVNAFVADITDRQFSFSESVDLLVLSHVVEHLEGPSDFLRSCLRKVDFKYAVIEVPLEDLPLFRLKVQLLGRKNLFGHVQFFTAHSFRRLVNSSGFDIVDEYSYAQVLSPELLRMIQKTEQLYFCSIGLRYLARRWLPTYLGPLWKKYYFSHCAVLCTKA